MLYAKFNSKNSLSFTEVLFYSSVIYLFQPCKYSVFYSEVYFFPDLVFYGGVLFPNPL